MPKVTMNTTPAGPASEVMAAAAAEVVVTDARGRKITLRKPGVLAQYRLIDALGPETAKNEVYVQMVLPLIYIGAIDGDTVIPMGRKTEIEALIQRLDTEGLTAVMEGVNANYGKPDPTADKAKLGN